MARAPVLGALVALIPGCFSPTADCTASDTCASASDAGVDGEAGHADASPSEPSPEGDADPSCDGNAHPSDDACVVHERFGVFVRPTAARGGVGSRARPFASLVDALKAATAAHMRVYACADDGPYKEALAIDASVDGAAIYGGFSCGAGWSYTTTSRATVAPSVGGAAIVVRDLALGLTIEDVDVRAHDGVSPGESSIAMIVASSARVSLRRVTLAAGNGASGAAGANGANGANGDTPGSAQHGSAATCTSAPAFHSGGAWSSPSTCGSVGGFGGEALLDSGGSDGASGMPNASVDPAGVANAGVGSSGAGVAGRAGGVGSSGLAGSAGAPASSAGFTATGYVAVAGGDGAAGHPGQGGGGGGASGVASLPGCTGASGGAGGAGGCGGGGGGGGKGGGASVALLVWSSGVALATVTLTAASGGSGGSGGNAGYGGSGGAGGDGGARLGSVVGAGGIGGEGGNGGDGGAGAGGNGGPSYALVHSGAPPTRSDDTTLAHGAGGAHGVGGALPQTTTSKAPDGIDGDAAPEHAL